MNAHGYFEQTFLHNRRLLSRRERKNKGIGGKKKLKKKKQTIPGVTSFDNPGISDRLRGPGDFPGVQNARGTIVFVHY